MNARQFLLLQGVLIVSSIIVRIQIIILYREIVTLFPFPPRQELTRFLSLARNSKNFFCTSCCLACTPLTSLQQSSTVYVYKQTWLARENKIGPFCGIFVCKYSLKASDPIPH